MSDPRARLSSLSTTLEDLTSRLVDTAAELRAAGDESISSELDEAERALLVAARRVRSAEQRLA